MIKKLTIYLSFFALLALIFFSWWKQAGSPVDFQNKESYIFVIPQGMGSGDIAKKLKGADLIKNIIAFQIMITRQGLSDKIQAGDYRLSPSMSLSQITQALSHGTMDVWVTLPEGLRKEQIADRITEAFAEYEADFNTKEFLAQTDNLEGYLFPDTYLIPKDASPSAIIRILTNTFEIKYLSLKPKNNLTKKELVTIASLIEREAKYEKDRNLISGILIKRLEEDWPLQIDAAVQYAKANLKCQGLKVKCDNWWSPVTPQDLKNIDSPYNTYLYKGLPPAPICNPGFASLKAAANPQSSKYWFYLSDDSGETHYAETIEEHDKNIEKFLL